MVRQWVPRVAGLILVTAGPCAPAAEASDGYTLSADPQAEGYTLADRGALVMSGVPALERREQFEIWRGPAGARLMRSITVSADGSYRVEAEWRSDATGEHHRARGLGAIGGEPLSLQMASDPGTGKIIIRRGDRAPEVIDAKCVPHCLLDMAPNSLAMFAMTRNPRIRAGEVMDHRWMGHALNVDMLVADGVTRLIRLGETPVRRPDGSVLTVRHDAFTETVTEMRSGKAYTDYANLWTDPEGRPLKWATARLTGLREGYEDLATLGFATREQVFPAVSEP